MGRDVGLASLALPFGPPIMITITTALTDAALLLDIAHIGGAQAVIRHGVLACGLLAILLDGGTHLFALTGIWPAHALRVALDREQREPSCDGDSAHSWTP